MNGYDDAELQRRYNQDFITVLTSADEKILIKRHTQANPIPYDKGYLFTSRCVRITSLQDLASALECPPQ